MTQLSSGIFKPYKDNNEYEAWLNYNCEQSNNWVIINNFNEIVSHSTRNCYLNDKICDNNDSEFAFLNDEYPIHVYFTYMTEDTLISLFNG